MTKITAPAITDPQRLTALHRLRLLDTPAEEAFDRLAKLAARILNTPVALVSLVDRDRQFFKSCLGLPEPWSRWRQTPLTHSFCQHVVASREPLVVSDARRDPDLLDNLAIRDLNVVAYLGCPLILPDGHVVGSFCVIDTTPRNWSDTDTSIVRDLAASVMTEIKLRHTREHLQELVQEQATILSASLRESEKRFRALVEVSAQIVWTSDAEGATDDSPTWRAFTGQTVEQWKGFGFLDVIHPEDRERIGKLWRDALVTLNPVDAEFRLRHHSGDWYWFSVRAVPLYNDKGAVTNWVGMCTDIDKRKRTETERERLLEELTARTEDLENFIYTISHDLKSPLITIGGFASLLEKDVIKRDTRAVGDSLTEIQRAVEQMSRNIQELLRFSRLGRVAPITEPVALDQLVAELLAQLAPIVDATHARVTVDPTLPTLIGDRKGLLRVFTNLLDNALKYRHPTRAPVIDIGWEHDTDELRLFVRDNGQGIKPEYQKNIFVLFQRANSRTEGAGVGLAISKRVVEAHDGRLWVESEPEKGSTFWIALPASAIADNPSKSP